MRKFLIPFLGILISVLFLTALSRYIHYSAETGQVVQSSEIKNELAIADKLLGEIGDTIVNLWVNDQVDDSYAKAAVELVSGALE